MQNQEDLYDRPDRKLSPSPLPGVTQEQFESENNGRGSHHNGNSFPTQKDPSVGSEAIYHEPMTKSSKEEDNPATPPKVKERLSHIKRDTDHL